MSGCRTTVRIGDVGRVVTGKTPPTARAGLFGSEYPFITPSDMGFDTRHVSAERGVSELGRAFQPQYLLPRKAVAVVCIGATIGKICMVDRPSFTNQQINAVIANDSLFEADFIFYALRLAAPTLLGLAGGAATPILNKSAFSDVTIEVPDFGEQRRISSILSAYDDLIENNTRRITVLEEMARRLYEEWFVHFRFPGHEQVRMVESELGLIPEGWEVKPLGGITDYINRGLSPRYDDNATGLVINQKCIRNGCLSLEPARRQSKPVPKEKTVRFGDVLINSTGVGTLGRVAQVYEEISECTVDSHVTIVRPKASCDIDFFGLALLGMESHFEQQGVGATGQTELGRGRIAETQLVVPPEQEQKTFGQAVRPLRQLSVNLARKNNNLRAQRDLLLPKLISGEIDVSIFPEAEAVTA